MSIDLSTLPWLVPAGADFRARSRAVESQSEGWGAALQALAQHGLNDSQLTTLARTLTAVRERCQGDIPGLRHVRLGLLSNATTKLLAPAIEASGLRHGLNLEVVQAEFNQVMQEATSAESTLLQQAPDVILLALDHNGYQSLGGGLNAGAGDAIEYLDTLRQGLRQHFDGTLIVQTVPCPPAPLFGSLDARLPQSQRSRIDSFNRQLIDSLEQSPDLLLDIDGLANAVGGHQWFDPVLWHIAKLPFSQRCVPLYAEHCARLVAAMLGRSRKCLVLDLDNTLWGGVIGDDGMDGIVIGQGSAGGEAFLAIQQMALDLRQRGIVLAVSSKNEDHIARAVFREHPEMLLREDHIAVFQANWNDKASNLEAIAKTLNIGIDALAFVDDNPAERRQVRQAHPSVAVPELGDDPALYPLLVAAAGYFESTAFSDDDRARAQQYQANAKRASLQGAARDMDSYLKSLDMTMTIGPFDSVGRSRIAQLINKSNQFNLTTKRYTESDVEKMQADADVLHFQIRLADTFGDNGMISVVILRKQDSAEHADAWEIDTWLMSCRVLGRRVERAVLNELVQAVAARGAKQITGLFLPTERNDIVRDHYRKLGFELVSTAQDGTTRWSLSVAGYQAEAVPMQIVRQSGAAA